MSYLCGMKKTKTKSLQLCGDMPAFRPPKGMSFWNWPGEEQVTGKAKPHGPGYKAEVLGSLPQTVRSYSAPERDTKNDTCLLTKRKSSELGMDSPLSNDSGLTVYRQKLQLSSNIHS